MPSIHSQDKLSLKDGGSFIPASIKRKRVSPRSRKFEEVSPVVSSRPSSARLRNSREIIDCLPPKSLALGNQKGSTDFPVDSNVPELDLKQVRVSPNGNMV